MALPLHPEYRTLPMLFYVPPLLPVLNATQENGAQRVETDLFSSLENARVPVRYMSRTLSAGNDELVIKSYQKMIAVRIYKRAETVGDVTKEEADAALAKAGMTAEEAEAISAVCNDIRHSALRRRSKNCTILSNAKPSSVCRSQGTKRRKSCPKPTIYLIFTLLDIHQPKRRKRLGFGWFILSGR
jgi:hypothetical protein